MKADEKPPRQEPRMGHDGEGISAPSDAVRAPAAIEPTSDALASAHRLNIPAAAADDHDRDAADPPEPDAALASLPVEADEPAAGDAHDGEIRPGPLRESQGGDIHPGPLAPIPDGDIQIGPLDRADHIGVDTSFIDPPGEAAIEVPIVAGALASAPAAAALADAPVETVQARADKRRKSWREQRWERRRRRIYFEEALAWVLVPVIIIACYLGAKGVLAALGTTPTALIQGIQTALSSRS